MSRLLVQSAELVANHGIYANLSAKKHSEINKDYQSVWNQKYLERYRQKKSSGCVILFFGCLVLVLR